MMTDSKFPGWNDGGDSGNVTRLPLEITPASLRDPRAIPPRPWLYGTILLRGFITVTVAPGGVGKSQLAMAIALAISSGRKFLGHHIHHQVNSWILNLEDPLDEMDRRLAALMIYHNIGAEEVQGRLFMNSGRDRPLVIAKLSEDGSTVVFPDKDAIIQKGRAAKIGHIVVDPYVRSHELDENSNTQQAAAAAAWAQIADELDCAVHLVHHTRKGAVTDIDASRGAKALTDHARAGLLLSAMPEEEATRLGIPLDVRHSYIRLDDAKANMAPKAEKAKWFHLQPIKLHNETPDYPNGDTVTAIEPWTPPNVFESLDETVANQILDQIDKGLNGVPYAPTARGKNNQRWVGNAVIEALEIEAGPAATIIGTWFKNGLLEDFDYRDKAEGKDRKGVKVNQTKRPGPRGSYGGV
jgi:hypothetical protein